MDDITKKKNEKNLDSLLAYLNGIGEEARKDFFYGNRENMDTLVWYYCDEFKNVFYKEQNEAIKEYYKQICSRTKTKIETKIESTTKAEIGKWWIHTGRVLGIYWGEIRGQRIGIECAFEKESSMCRLGMFHIYVATWGGFDIKPYEEDLKKDFPVRGINEDKTAKDRTFILVEKYKPEETKKIIDTLSDTYNKLKKIIEEHEDA